MIVEIDRVRVGQPAAIPPVLPGDRPKNWAPEIMGRYLLVRREANRYLCGRVLRDLPPRLVPGRWARAVAWLKIAKKRLAGAGRVLAGTAEAVDWDDR